jgi:hypothetical protein
MSDALRKVQAGQPLAIPASAYNAFIDAALDFRQRTAHIVQGAQPSFQQTGVILVRNDSGSDRARFEVLGLDVPVITPDVNEEAFRNRLALAGVLPAVDTHEGRYAVLSEPVAAGKIGRAVVDGVTVVKVTVADEAQEPRFAEMADGDATGLAAQASGSTAILWRAGGTGPQWAVVRLLGKPAAAVGLHVFPVALSQTGGTQGTATAPASWTYRVTDLETAEELLAGVNPTASPHQWRRPSLGPVVPATFGYAHWQDDGEGVQELALGWINEVASPVARTFVTAWRLDKTGHRFQVKTCPALLLAQGAETGWTDVADADGGILDQGVAL